MSMRCSTLQVPFMRNWFKDQDTTHFTVALWFLRGEDCTGKAGLVHNGDCVDPPTFLIEAGDDGSSQTVYAGLDTDGHPLTLTLPADVSLGIFKL